jgi:hypothetical protein
MTKRTIRTVETQRKMRKQKIPRAPVTTNLGNTSGVRNKLKKQAGIRRARAAAPAEA